MRNMSITQTVTLAWAGDTTIADDVERVGFITRVDIGIEITPSATLTGDNAIDGLFRLIQNFRIVGGSHVYMTLPADDACLGGTLLHYKSQLDGFGYGHRDGGIAAPQSVVTPMVYPVHFGTRPFAQGHENPFDLSAFIPAAHESQLRMEWTTSGNDVMDASVTITSAVLRLTIHRVSGTPDEIAAEMQNQGVVLPSGASGMVPAWTATIDSPTATTTDFDARVVNLPTGGYLKRILVGIQDATATRSIRASDELTRWSINSVRTNERLYQTFLMNELAKRLFGSNLTLDSGASESAGTSKFGADFNAHAVQGIGEIDLRVRPMESKGADGRMSNALTKEYGWNMSRAARGDFTIGEFLLTNAAGDDMLYLFERYQPYSQPL